jgi:caffeoyl-CoA O-methyltransferase
VSELIDPGAERFALEHTTAFDGVQDAAAAWTAANTGSPQMMAGVAEARLLEVLIVAGGARRVLEIGTFTGVGALTMAAALPADGQLVTLEIDEERAAVARRFFEQGGLAERIEVVVGPALQSMARLQGPFDLVWIDALKSEYPAYFEAALPLLSDRGVIAADNLFRAGATLESGSDEEGTVAMRDLARRVQDDPALHNVLLTVGDGVLLAWRAPSG